MTQHLRANIHTTGVADHNLMSLILASQYLKYDLRLYVVQMLCKCIVKF